jgi:mevalonate pyrophosphate decarboxylase
MEFKDQGKRKGNGTADTLYFNAYTEDLFVWHNDLDADTDRYLKISESSAFFKVSSDCTDETIAGLSRYAVALTSITKSGLSPSQGDEERIKISGARRKSSSCACSWRFARRVIDGHSSYQWVKHLYIDDPIASLDE